MNNKRKEKLADLLLDVAKYIVTAGLIATWFGNMGHWDWYSYLLSLGAILLSIIGGLWLCDEKNDVKQIK